MFSRRCIAIFIAFSALFWAFPTYASSKSVCSEVLQKGEASWYGPRFHGKLTKNEEVFDADGYSAAHPTLPFGTMVKVVNNKNKRTAYVRVNDRGAFGKTRVIDLSRGAAKQLGMLQDGVVPVTIYKCGK